MGGVKGKAGKASVGEQELLHNKWNKDKEGAWRLDVDIGVSWFDEDADEINEEDGIAIGEILDGDNTSDESSSEGASSNESLSEIDSSSDSSGD